MAASSPTPRVAEISALPDEVLDLAFSLVPRAEWNTLCAVSLRWHRIVTASERLWGESLWGFRWLGVKTAWCPERRKHCRRSRQTMLAWLRPRAAAIRRLTLENHHCEVLGLALPKLQSLDLVCTNSELRSEELLAALAAHTGVTWLALDCREDQRDAARELDLAALQPALQHLSRLRFFRWWYDADDTVSSIAGLAACPQLSSLHLRCCDYSEADLRCCLRLEVLVLEDELAEGAHSASEPGDLPALQELTLPCVPHGLPAGLCLPSITRLDLGQMDEPSAVVLPPAFSQLVSLRELDTSWRRCRQAWQRILGCMPNLRCLVLGKVTEYVAGRESGMWDNDSVVAMFELARKGVELDLGYEE